MQSNGQTSNQGQQYLRQRDLLDHYLPFSATTLWRKVRNKDFPSPVKLSAGITAWRTQDVADWLKAQEVK